MSAWGTQDMSAALPDPVNPTNDAPPEAVTDAPKVNPQEAGWVKKVDYDYDTYNKSSKELMEAQQQQPTRPFDDLEDAVGGLRHGDWAGNAAIYQWNDEYGDVGPEFKELEAQLFGAANHTKTGIKFDKIAMIDVVQEGNVRIKPVMDFKDAGLHPVMMRNIELAGYLKPTPIQQYTLPTIFEGKDLIACAQTGSGKTAAFLIPILSKLMGKAKKLCAPRPNPATFQPGVTPGVRAEPLVLIVAPTRELATQIFDEARRFCYRTMFRPCAVYGGGPIAEQISHLQKGCDLLIGTPGRLVDFINRPHLLTLKRLKYMVIDEADEMVQSDWENELKQIMSGGDQEEGNINYLMFSATFPKICRELAEQHLAHNHVRIRVGRAGSTHDNIKQDVVWAEPHAKRQCLLDLLMSMPPARTIIFVNSKRTADEVDDFLFNLNFPCTSIHGDRTQREREDSLRAFRKGKSPVLIATGISARGLDIHNVMHVINYDLPSPQYGGIQEYIHRIGRTGRIGNLGLATSFYNSRDADLGEVLVKTLLETHQSIPDFLQEYIPEGFTADGQGDVTKLLFEVDEEEEQADENAGGETDGWGSTDAVAPAAGGWGATENAAGGWGEPNIPQKVTPGGWGAHPDAAPAVPLAAGGWGAQPTEPAQPVPPTQAVQPPSTQWGAPPAPAHVAQPTSQWGAAPAPAPVAQPASGQWSAPPSAKPVATPQAAQPTSWGQAPAAVRQAQPAQAPLASGWGAPAAPAPTPVAQPPAPKAAPAAQASGWGAPSGGDAWGASSGGNAWGAPSGGW